MTSFANIHKRVEYWLHCGYKQIETNCNMIRALSASSAILLASTSISLCDFGKSHDQFTYHPNKGFPKRFTPNIGNAVPKAMPFVLLGVGRMDSLHNCVVAIAVGPSTLGRAKKWMEEERSEKGSSFSLIDHLLSRENIITPFSISNPAKIAVAIRVSSPITTRQLIRALDRFLPSHGHDLLLDRVEAALGRNETLLTGEEVSFYWMDNDDLYILHNGDVFDMINFPFLNRSFLEIFVGRGTNIISRELYRSVIDRLPTIEDT